MDVELVSVQTADGVRLDGYLRRPSAPAANGLEVVICHHGVGGAFYTPSFFDTVGEALLSTGTAILRVNNRGHDQAYLQAQRRLGAAYELIDECRHDFSAWLDFAVAQGFQRTALWGHSLGAVKTVYFLAATPEARVTCAIASSPPRFLHNAYVVGDQGQRFAADIARAQELIAAGQPEALLEAAIPQARPFSARTYLDKYGPDARFDYFQHLPSTAVPLLLTLGGLEGQDVSFAPLASQGPGLNARLSNVNYRLVEGADHFYTGRTDQLWSDVQSWLTSVAGLAAV